MVILLRRLGIHFRLWLMAAVFFLPMGVLFWNMVTVIQQNIDFSSLEKSGNAYQRPLERLLQYLPEYLQEGLARSSKMEAVAGDIDAAFGELQKIQAEIGESLQFTEEGLSKRKREAVLPSRVQERWLEVKKSGTALSAEIFSQKMTALVSDVRTMITHSGDTSNLILDPDLDSYYLMDATLAALPQTQDRLAVIAAFGKTVLSKKAPLSVEERRQAAVFAAQLVDNDLARVSGDLQTALNEDINFYGRCESLQQEIPPVLTTYVEATQAALSLLEKLVNEEKPSFDAAAFAATFRTAREESFHFWYKASAALDMLLNRRLLEYKNDLNWRVMLTSAALLVALVLVVVISRSITHPLRGAIRVADAIASGTLEIQAEAKVNDELGMLGRAMNQMATNLLENQRAQKESLEKLQGILEQVSQASQAVASQADQIASASTALAGGATEQASAIEEINASMTEIGGRIRTNAENAQTASQIIISARDNTDQAAQNMTSMITAMNEIGVSSKNIAKIIRAVDDIAFQTNLLALNAAVEAARAGRHGKGFAVVAEEVRNLAGRSAKAAKETEALIEDSVKKIQSGTSVAAQTEVSLKNIIANVHKAADLVGEISAQAHEEARSVTEINLGLEQVEQVTQRNTAQAEETASACEGLRNSASMLETLLQQSGGMENSKTAPEQMVAGTALRKEG